MFTDTHRVLEWDRRNTGAADVWFGGSAEHVQWADDLVEILHRLDLAPAHLAGGSAGARVAYLVAIRNPEVVRSLVLWSISGGAYASQNLGYQYHAVYINEALRGGMSAVAETAFFAERIRENPANRDRLLAMDPDEFVAVMRSWNASFYPRVDSPVIGATVDELRSIGCPTLIFDGNDDFHPTEAARAMHGLVSQSELAELPWTGGEWMRRYLNNESIWDLYPAMVPRIKEFLASVET